MPHYTRNQGLELLSKLDINTQNVLLWRAGLKSELLNAGSAKVCFHFSDQILDIPSMFKFCEENIKNITFVFISKERMETAQDELNQRSEQ